MIFPHDLQVFPETEKVFPVEPVVFPGKKKFSQLVFFGVIF
jgi:hypothetical protein